MIKLKTILYLSLIWLSAIVMAASFLVETTSARSAWYGRGWDCQPVSAGAGRGNGTRGYFSNGCWVAASPPYSPVLVGGMPRSNDTPAEVISFLKGKMNGNNWQKAAAAFIVHAMLGYNGASASRSVSAAKWSELERRLNGHTITYTSSYSSGGINTMAVRSGSTYDIVAYGDTKTAPALVFKDKNGVTRFVIFTDCANPVGQLGGGLNPDVDNYNLTPEITGTPQIHEGTGGEATISPTVVNSGSTQANGIDWQITDFRVNPDGTVPGADTGTAAPESYYGNTFIDKETGRTNFRVGLHEFNQRTRTIGDFPVGTKVCFALSVRPYSHQAASNVWWYGTPFCVTIAKSPKAQVWGGDLLVGSGSNIWGSVSSRDTTGVNRLFGSWVEYGVLAGGVVEGVASGAGYAGGSTSTSFCDVSLLTFSNAQAGSCSDAEPKGGYTALTLNSNIKARFTTGTANNSATLNPAAMNSGQYTSNRTALTISVPAGAEIPKSKSVIISAPNATVTINRDIRYTNEPLTHAREIPQVVIIARQINIRGNVSQVDAWLVADVINTCSDVPLSQSLTASTCNNRLVVNGPVMTDQLHLRRTFGADVSNPGAPAEIFNLRPDAYLWATNLTASSGRLQNTATKELPPRF